MLSVNSCSRMCGSYLLAAFWPGKSCCSTQVPASGSLGRTGKSMAFRFESITISAGIQHLGNFTAIQDMKLQISLESVKNSRLFPVQVVLFQLFCENAGNYLSVSLLGRYINTTFGQRLKVIEARKRLWGKARGRKCIEKEALVSHDTRHSHVQHLQFYRCIFQADWQTIQSAAEVDHDENHTFSGMCAFSMGIMGEEAEGNSCDEVKHLHFRIIRHNYTRRICSSSCLSIYILSTLRVA